MELLTKVNIDKLPFHINHTHNISMIGSCFANNIGKMLIEDGFNVSINPFGILFNPISVSRAIRHITLEYQYKEQDLINYNEQWISLNHHSNFNCDIKEDTLFKINSKIKETKDFYKSSDILFITFGTAWVYTYNINDKIVANCHKIPSKYFSKKLLSIEEILRSYEILIPIIRKNNPSKKIVFTISPVRHWKDGIIENNRSKSVLHLAIMEMIKRYENTYYFPSYEIMIDELRDYRFYKEDMLHPNNQAVKYIYKRFSTLFYNEETKSINNQLRKIKLSLNHKPFNKNSKDYNEFKKKLEIKINNFRIKYPYINFCL